MDARQYSHLTHAIPRLTRTTGRKVAILPTIRIILALLASAFVFGLIQLICVQTSPRMIRSLQGEEALSQREWARSSHLLPKWADSIKEASLRGSSTKDISFQLYDLRSMMGEELSPPPFFYAVEDTLHSAKNVMDTERFVMFEWMNQVRKIQQQRRARPPHCLDIGSNGGFYALMARAGGCRTMAVDAQPRCLERLSSSVAVNDFTTNFDLRWTAVGDDDTSPTVTVGAERCSGLWAIRDSEWINEESSTSIVVPITPLSDILKDWITDDGPIDVFKIDVEGSEVAVLHSALHLFTNHQVGVLFVEITPGRVLNITPLATILATIETIYKAGYVLERRSHIFDVQGAKDLFARSGAKHVMDPQLYVIRSLDDFSMTYQTTTAKR